MKGIIAKEQKNNHQLTFPDSKCRSQYEVLDGEKHGKEVLYFSNGTLWQINSYNKGVLHGECKVYHEKGNLQAEMYYSEGRLHGSFKMYHPNGVLWSESTFINGMEEGESIIYYASGRIKEKIPFVNGKQHGVYVEYFQNGNPKAIKRYHENRLHGICLQYSNNGTLREYEHYNKGLKDSVHLTFFDDGELSTVTRKDEAGEERTLVRFNQMGNRQYIRFNNGKIHHDIMVDYYEDGLLKSEGVYIHNKKHGYHYYYDKTGSVSVVRRYKRGSLISKKEVADL